MFLFFFMIFSCTAVAAAAATTTARTNASDVHFIFEPEWKVCLTVDNEIYGEEEELVLKKDFIMMTAQDWWRQTIFPRLENSYCLNSSYSCFKLPLNPLLLRRISKITGLSQVTNITSNTTYYKTFEIRIDKLSSAIGYSIQKTCSDENNSSNYLTSEGLEMKRNEELIRYRMVLVEKIIVLASNLTCFELVFFCEKLPCKVTGIHSEFSDEKVCLPETLAFGYDSRKLVVCRRSKSSLNMISPTYLNVTYNGPSWDHYGYKVGQFWSQKHLRVSTLPKSPVMIMPKSKTVPSDICNILSEKCSVSCKQSCADLVYRPHLFKCNNEDTISIRRSQTLNIFNNTFPVAFQFASSVFIKSRELLCIHFSGVSNTTWSMSKFISARFRLEVLCKDRQQLYPEIIRVDPSHCFSDDLVKGLVRCGKVNCKEPTFVKSLLGPFMLRLKHRYIQLDLVASRNVVSPVHINVTTNVNTYPSPCSQSSCKISCVEMCHALIEENSIFLCDGKRVVSLHKNQTVDNKEGNFHHVLNSLNASLLFLCTLVVCVPGIALFKYNY